MKRRIILIALYLMATLLLAWPIATIEVWTMNNTRTGAVNGFILTPIGTGGTFMGVGTEITTPPPNGASYYLKNNVNTNHESIPPSAIATLGASNYWTIETRLWLPTKATGAAGTSRAAYFCFNGGTGYYYQFFILTVSDWNPWGNNMQLGLGSDIGFVGAWSSSDYTSIGGVANAWNRYTTTFNSGVYKFYGNGSLIWTSGTGNPNIFATPGTFRTNNYPDYGGYYGMGMSGIVMVPTDTGGIEILDATSTFTPTFTASPTFSFTPTYTYTPIYTPTYTITPTFTPTQTKTPIIHFQGHTDENQGGWWHWFRSRFH